MSLKKKPQREARLWEDTVVMAIRDFQWITFFQSNPKSPVQVDGGQKLAANTFGLMRGPSGMIKLDGRAEGRLGDVALAAGEKLFLIEVKPTTSQFRDEWQKKGMFAPKTLYRSLAYLTRFFKKVPEVEAFIERASVGSQSESKETKTQDALLMFSLRGHMMAHWECEPDSSEGPGAVMVLPYVSAVALSVAATDLKRRQMITAVPFRVNIKTQISSLLNIKHPLDVLWDPNGEVLLCGKGQTRGNFSIGPLGLEPEEFQTYVDWLVKNAMKAGDLPFEPINAIVLSSEGRFFQWLTSTEHLAKLLKLKFTVPSDRPSEDRRYRFR